MSVTLTAQQRRVGFLAAGLLLFVILLLLPPAGGLTESARNMAAVAALMGVWWIGEAVPLAVTALLPLVLFPVLGILPSKLVAPHYGNHLIFLFLGGFMIALAMERCHLHKRLALRIILWTGTGLKRIVLGFMAASAFLSMWISNTATCLMLLPVAMAVVRQVAASATLDGKTGKEVQHAVQANFGLVLMLGLAYSASLGGIGTLIGTPPNIVFAGFFKTQFPDQEEISFVRWMILALPVIVIFLPCIWWYLCRMAPKIPLDRFKTWGHTMPLLHGEYKNLGPMSRAERFVAVVFIMTAGLWIFRQPLDVGGLQFPGWSSWFAHPDMIHDATVAMAMGILLLAAPLGWNGGMELHGRQVLTVLDWETVRKGVPWGILFLFGGGFALAGGVKVTGLDMWIGGHLTNIHAWPLWLVVFSLCLGMTFLTELTSNTATATMILPVVAAAATAVELEPLMLMIPATLSVSFAFMMPVATPPNAIIYSSGWVSVPQMALAGLVLNLIGAVLITVLTLIWVPLVFL
ncbi:MAG: SLC13 family permease [Nitrospinaceae bacterium]